MVVRYATVWILLPQLFEVGNEQDEALAVLVGRFLVVNRRVA